MPPVPVWILVLVVTVTWCTNVAASATAAAVEDGKNPLESGQPRGTSALLGLVVMPMAFVLVALGADALFDTTWASRVVVGAHVPFAILYAFSIAKGVRQLQKSADTA